MKYKVFIDNYVFPTLVAKTAEDHSRGLMERAWPPPVMCFPYKEALVRKFWMLRTPSPLDIIFCRGNKVVSIHKGIPHSTAMVGPNEPTDFVIELPYGTAKKCGFKIGSEVKTIKHRIEYKKLHELAMLFDESIKA